MAKPIVNIFFPSMIFLKQVSYDLVQCAEAKNWNHKDSGIITGQLCSKFE